MRKCISLSYGEITLKKDNKKYFENVLIKNIKVALKDFEFEINKDQSKIYIYTEDFESAIENLKPIFGISYIALQFETNQDIGDVYLAAVKAMDYERKNRFIKTFKVETKRADKKYPLKSPEISRMVGGYILKHYGDLKVDVNNPDIILRVDIRKNAFVSASRIKGLGGMPVGSNGRVMSLLSGGIDSPVASILAMKRGLSCDFIHFHSYPFTSGRSFDKTKDLATLASKYQPYSMLFSFNLLKFQEEITKDCDIRFTTILQRRAMIRIATRLCRECDREALVTGENLGQVASQTLSGMSVVDPVTDLMILRPLICFDKNEIVDLARKYNTYETSILPYEDCCTVFVAKHPKTNPTLEQVLHEEAKIDYNKIEDEIFNSGEEFLIK